MESFAKKVEDLVVAGWNLEKFAWYTDWVARVTAFLAVAIDDDAGATFAELGRPEGLNATIWTTGRDRQIGHLEGLAMRIEAKGLLATKQPQPTEIGRPPPQSASTRVFVVHGHDHGTKETTARFLEKLGLETVILHEKANEGRTVVEKFEAHADVGFAVALLTPDDLGASAAIPERQLPRARQNVILELGYFTGKLGRSKVCALFRLGIEIPSDFHGVLFIEIDEAGAWKAKLAQELVQAGMKINLQGLLGA